MSGYRKDHYTDIHFESQVVGGESDQSGRYAYRTGETGFISASDRGVRCESGLSAAQCQAHFVEQGETLVLSQRNVLTPDESSGIVVLQGVVEIDAEVDITAQLMLPLSMRSNERE